MLWHFIEHSSDEAIQNSIRNCIKFVVWAKAKIYLRLNLKPQFWKLFVVTTASHEQDILISKHMRIAVVESEIETLVKGKWA